MKEIVRKLGKIDVLAVGNFKGYCVAYRILKNYQEILNENELEMYPLVAEKLDGCGINRMLKNCQ